MKLVLWVLALFAAAAAVVYTAYYNIGSALFTAPPYTIELALNTFIILLLVAFVLFYMLLRILSGLFGTRERSRRKKSNRAMLSGLKAFFEERYDEAGKAAESAFKLTNTQTTKAINAVIAARSAHLQGNYPLRDQLLTSVSEQAPKERALKLVTEAELMLDEGRPADALNALQLLYSTGGLQSTPVLQLELKAQQMAKNWDAVLELTKVLANRQSADQALVSELRHRAHLENIKKNTSNLSLLRKYWHDLSAQEKNDAKLAVVAARAFMALDDNATAQKTIENILDTQPDPESIALYADCLSGSVSWQIQRAEYWLRKYSNNAALLLTLGRLCAYGELWGKAQNYLEASLSIEQGYPAHLALAQLLERLGKQEAASEHYRKGLEFALKQIST
jgi:HemY protein